MIEYSGMLVRSVLTDKREKYYESKVGLMSRLIQSTDFDASDNSNRDHSLVLVIIVLVSTFTMGSVSI